MVLQRMISSLLIGLLMLNVLPIAYATDNLVVSVDGSTELSDIVLQNKQEEITSDENNVTPKRLADLPTQLDRLYHDIGKNLNIDYIYVKILHLLSGGKAVYADQYPNIYSEVTVDSMTGPFEIAGASQNFALEAEWVLCPDEEIERPSKYYLPDAAYSTTSEVVKIMNKRYYADRGQMQEYFNALSSDVKTNIIFCESIMEYIGSSREAIESFYGNYEKILYEKEKNENVVEVMEDGTFKIKPKFREILTSNNISDERDLEVLALVLSFDSKLAISSDPDSIKEDYVLPYILDYTSRENMMLAAMSVVGKVRYVWGGGRGGTGTIDGINPSWQAFYDTYQSSEDGSDYDMCIQPSSSWCPIHGKIESENGCLLMADKAHNVEQYVETRKEIMDTAKMEGEKYSELLEQSSIDFDNGINTHRLDGLDCAGFTSWLFNQITDKREYDTGARYFISASGLKSIEYGSKMLPGDVVSWGKHIVFVVGPAVKGSSAYVIIESSPNMVKFGVIYYGGARYKDVEKAIRIASEANDLIGGIPLTEKTHIYNLDSLGFDEAEENGRYIGIGRLNYSFVDENIVVNQYGKKIKDMSADEIIQYTIDNYNEQYISGLNSYTGSVFDITKFISKEVDRQIIEKNEIDIASILEETNIFEVETLNIQ